jgi:hypothetical protein
MKSIIEAGGSPPAMVFDNQFPLMTIEDFCSQFGYSKKTIYDWRYRPKKNKIPSNLVVKIRGKVFIRADIYRSLRPF